MLPLVYEGRHVVKEVNQSEIDDWFEKYTETLTKEQKEDLKRKISTADYVMQAEPVIRRVARDVSEHFSKFLKHTGLKAQLVTPSKAAAIQFKKWLDQLGEVRSEVLISGPDDREGDEDIYTPNRKAVNQYWKGVFERFGNRKRIQQPTDLCLQTRRHDRSVKRCARDNDRCGQAVDRV